MHASCDLLDAQDTFDVAPVRHRARSKRVALRAGAGL